MFTEFPQVVAHALRGRVFSYSSYFMLKGHSMAMGFSPNHRAGSKEVWTVLLTIKRLVSWSFFCSRNCHFGIGYGSRCLRLLQLEQGLYGG